MNATAKLDEKPISVIVRRRVKSGHEAEFEAAMRDFIGFALAWPGHLDIHLLRPVKTGSTDYTVIDQFATAESRRSFKESSGYQEWMRRLKNLTEGDPQIEEMGGVGGWFTSPTDPCAGPPPKWKMACVTYLGVYPLAVGFASLFNASFPKWNFFVVNIPANVAIVASLTWVVMPLLTRLFQGWLFPQSQTNTTASFKKIKPAPQTS